MKSAYELAMERLEKEHGPGKKLTDEQRAKIAGIDNQYEAKIAELRLSYDSKMAAEPHEAEGLRQELAETVKSLEAKRDKEKEAIWKES